MEGGGGGEVALGGGGVSGWVSGRQEWKEGYGWGGFVKSVGVL